MRIRLRRPTDSATVVLRREAATDPRLTLTAVGVLALLTALPDDRPITIAELLHRTGEDPVAVQGALDALEAAGYLHLDPDIGPAGEAYLSDRPAVPTLPAPTAPPVPPRRPSGPVATAAAAQASPPPRPAHRPETPSAAAATARADALEQIRHTLASGRTERSRQQAQTEAALRARIAAAAQARRQAAAERATHRATEASPPTHQAEPTPDTLDRGGGGSAPPPGPS